MGGWTWLYLRYVTCVVQNDSPTFGSHLDMKTQREEDNQIEDDPKVGA